MPDSTDCFECLFDLEHCHGTVIVHADGACECTDDASCDVPWILHAFSATCEASGCCPCEADAGSLAFDAA